LGITSWALFSPRDKLTLYKPAGPAVAREAEREGGPLWAAVAKKQSTPKSRAS
jgi:hypothetical protein